MVTAQSATRRLRSARKPDEHGSVVGGRAARRRPASRAEAWRDGARHHMGFGRLMGTADGRGAGRVGANLHTGRVDDKPTLASQGIDKNLANQARIWAVRMALIASTIIVLAEGGMAGSLPQVCRAPFICSARSAPPACVRRRSSASSPCSPAHGRDDSAHQLAAGRYLDREKLIASVRSMTDVE
jgi:hypothetical protein